MPLSIDIHVLQTVPPSNINRDDTGSPKTAVFGGVRRARVSSQAWKRATRLAFSETYDDRDLGVRTKRVVEIVADAITEQTPELEDRAPALAAEVIKAAGIKLTAPRKKAEEKSLDEAGYLIFLSRQQVARLAALASTGQKIDGKAARAAVKDGNSVDVALFGRMVADVSDLSVDAACQVAHALSTHGVEPEFDYFTAVDDHKSDDIDEDAGAAMIGTVEFSSSTLYRFATVSSAQLAENLGDMEATVRAVTTFVDSFVRSMPTGKVTTFGNRTIPELVYVTLRDDHPVSLVGAFETPVRTSADGGHAVASSAALARHAADVERAYGAAPIASWIVGVGPAAEPWQGIAGGTSLPALLESLRGELAERLADTA